MSEHGDVWRSPCGAVELRCGRWQDVLADVESADAVITDPPYSDRTEKGFRTSRDLRHRGLGYDPITREWVAEWATRWAGVPGWVVAFGDHVSVGWFRAEFDLSGRYTFHPLPLVKVGAAPRLQCDGPASQSEHIAVARPRAKRFMSWGSLPGWYSMATVRHGHGSIGVSGAKSADLMRAIVRDYSRPGDLVCDPCAGGATTLLAAAMEGRRAIGAEMDPTTFDLAVKRLSRGWTVDMFSGRESAPAEQMALGGTDD